jgi:UPF0042 nucleotide-binding protein
VLVTGLSGAGRTTALKILEDMGFEAVDNLPLTLLAGLTQPGDLSRGLAIGIDSRTRGFTPAAALRHFDRLRADHGVHAWLVFLTCDDETLRRRFTATRRRHPLAQDRPVADGIARERLMLAPLRERADLTLDTSELSIGELRRIVQGHFGPRQSAGASIAVTSFSYRLGLPREADLVFDVRFLDNPHYDEALRPLTGRDPAVAAFLEADRGYAAFQASLGELLAILLPRFEREGKSYLTIAVGCTGGRHRSVFVAERLGESLRAGGREAFVRHRDLERRGGGEDS